MSAEPERVFSRSKITISDHKCRLGIKLIKALECLKSWIEIEEWLNKTVLMDTPTPATAPARGL
jgi:hypothetical protein